MTSIAENTVSIEAMRDRLELGLLDTIPHCFVTGDIDNRVPNTTNIAFEYIEGEALLLLLNQVGIATSSGSACTSGSLEASHVMKAMNIPLSAAHGTLRFSLSKFNTDADIDHVLEQLPGIVSRLRELSPYWDSDTNSEKADSFAPVYG
ncbi:cysteine desulfurase NifS subfamily [Vibrio astriarenae]|nr:cysteine desulfurase NifS subfamily [Vibrio sp. C7]